MRFQKVYDAFPPFLKNFASSAAGFYLQRLRYGAETEALVSGALERETWTPDAWERWRKERLAALLRGAALHVPYYREMWRRRRQDGDESPWDVLENWPVLEKEAVRSRPADFVRDDASGLVKCSTSGSTGTPVTVYSSRRIQREWYALFEARWRRWHGVSLSDRWGILGGKMVVPYGRIKPPFWVWNAGMKQLYMSCHHMSPEFLPHYIRAINAARLRYILGYTSALHSLARYILETGDRPAGLRVVITNAEPVTPDQKKTIAEAFQCPVRETYGMTEMAAAGGECEEGTLHVWPEAGFVEVLNEGRPVPAGETGELICTGLLNTVMPLIRYRAGDRGAIAPEGKCACGRTLPAFRFIEGRTDDVLITPDGREVGRLDHVFKSDLPVREGQIIQEEVSVIRVRYVPAGEPSEKAESLIAEALRRRMGNVRVVFEPVEKIARGPGGKFRAVINRLSSGSRGERV